MLRKAYNFLGLAQRAGKIQSGDASAEAILIKGQAKLVLLAQDASDKTKQHFSHIAEQYKVPYIIAGEKLELGIAIGKSPRAVLVIKDQNFSSKLVELFGQTDNC